MEKQQDLWRKIEYRLRHVSHFCFWAQNMPLTSVYCKK